MGEHVPPLEALYATMRRIRSFEDALLDLWRAGEVPGLLHTAHGLEAVAAGVLAHCDPARGDMVASTHRPDAHALAFGLDMTAIVAEILGRAAGLNGGRAGQMHLLAPERGFLGANGIVGGSVPAALGAALARRLEGRDGVAVAFMGDGALNQGVVLESLNLAAVWRLPVLFVVEDNGWHEFTPRETVTAGDLAARLAAFGIPVEAVDGGDPVAVWEAARAAIAAIRNGDGPQAIVATVPRLVGHHSADAQGYRAQPMARPGSAADPVVRAARLIEAEGRGDRRSTIDEAADEEVRTALQAARAARPADSRSSPPPKIPAATCSACPEPLRGVPEGMTEMTLAQALRGGLIEAMAADPAIIVMGEDVEEGTFGVTSGLVARFGRARVRNTPICEAAFLGVALGAAAAGRKPVVEVMFADFASVGMDQIVNQIAKWRYLDGGRRPLPIVIRMATGAGISAGAHHSQNLAHVFASTAGLKCLYPSSPGDALRALKAALADPDPVILLEPKALYETSGPVDPDAPPLADGRVRIWRDGDAASVVAIGPMVPQALAAAAQLAEDGIAVQVVEPLWLAPLPMPALEAALSRRRRVVIVDEGAPVSGLADALAARIGHALWDELVAPPLTLTPPHTPIPFAPALEASWVPSARTIAEAVRELCRSSEPA